MTHGPAQLSRPLPNPYLLPSSTLPAAAVFTACHQKLGTPRRVHPPLHVLRQSRKRYTLQQFEAKSRAFCRTQLAGLPSLPLSRSPPSPSSGRPPPASPSRSSTPMTPLHWLVATAQPHSRKMKRCRHASGDNQGGGGEDVEEKTTVGWRLSSSPWNLQAIAPPLTRLMPDDVPGVTSPMVYIRMLFSWFVQMYDIVILVDELSLPLPIGTISLPA